MSETEIAKQEALEKIAGIDPKLAGNIDIEKVIDKMCDPTEKITDKNTLILIALADVFEIPPMEHRFDWAFKAAFKLKDEVDSGILQYPPPAKAPHEKSVVLHITTSFGKRYTCRTMDELEIFIDNYKIDKKRKRDEDVDITIGFGRMTEEAYAQVPACKYFIKPK